MTPEESLKTLRKAVKTVGRVQDQHFYLTLPYHEVGRWLRLVERGAEFKVGGSKDSPKVCWDLEEESAENRPEITQDEFGITIHGSIKGLQIV